MHELMGERITVSLAENAIDALRTENPGLNPTPERIMERSRTTSISRSNR